MLNTWIEKKKSTGTMTGKIFLLLLKKNFLVRKKHYLQSIIMQIIIPIFLFLIAQTVRLLTNNEPVRVVNNTIHKPTVIDHSNILMLDKSATFIKYTPFNDLTLKLMSEVGECLQLGHEAINGSLNEDTMIAELQREQATHRDLAECVGVVFETIDNNTLPKNVKYKLRISNVLSTELYDPEENGDKANTILYSGPVIPLQFCLDKALINEVQSNSPRLQYEMKIQQMPYPPYIDVNKATIVGGETIAEFVRLALLIVLCIEVSFPANEKHIGINILMSVNGVKNQLNLFSWLFSGALFSTFYLVPLIVILTHFMPPTLVPFLSYGNGFIVWLALFIHVCHVIAFGYHLSAYFWKPFHGIFATFMVIMLMNIVATFVHGPKSTHFLLYLGILSPNFILKRIFMEITTYESKLIGVRWSNMFIAGTSGGPAEGSIGVMMIFSILGALFHFFMTIYVYSVRPGKYGISLSPLFCFQKRKNNRITIGEEKMNVEHATPVKKEFEVVPPGSFEAGIRIRGLKKIYTTDFFRRTNVYALRGVSMDFYKGQITALLGHNGAGKTTMMSILSGLTGSTDGAVFISGKNIQHDPTAISDNIGLCPQENMVFPDLSVQQQLMFFGRLKAKTKTNQELEVEVNRLLAKVNLTDKKHAIPKELSGGQKRRLCLAMAVIGDGNVLILDEPTSGMDAESKREVWDIVLKLRGEKTIIISTHDMEEADILGDRVAIMHTGKLKSYGTSMFLKKLYGDGQIEVTLSVESWCDLTKIFEEIGMTAQVSSRDEGKIVLAIPISRDLPQILDKLEKSKKQLGITGISVSVITLEQVFLKVTREDTDEVDSNDQIKSFQRVRGAAYYMQSFIAFLIKKLIFVRKNPWTTGISLLLPCLTSILLLLEFGLSSTTDKPLDLTLKSYYHSKAFIRSENATLAEYYKDTIEDYSGTGILIQPNLSLTDALLNYANNDVGLYRDKVIISGEFGKNETHTLTNGFYSGSAIYSVPITINALSNALIKTVTDDKARSIQISAQALPASSKIKEELDDLGSALTLSMIVFLAPALALYVTQPLQEALSGVKQLQGMTGAPKLMYWASMFFFDLIIYMMSILLLIASFILVDISLGTQLYHAREITITLELFLLFGISALPFIYMSSFFKKSTNVTINILSVAPLIIGVIEVILVSVKINLQNHIFDKFHDLQSKIFLLFPHLSFTYGHLSFFSIVTKNARCRRMPDHLLNAICHTGSLPGWRDECCEMKCVNGTCQKLLPYFVSQDFFPSLRTSMTFLGCSSLLFFAIIFILEQQYVAKLLAKIRGRKQETGTSSVDLDEMVIKENAVVANEITTRAAKQLLSIADDENVFLVHGLKKSYGKLQAVKGISFRVKEGECFGLLGVNGAGKSTSFRMLTGAEIPNGGTMYLKNYNIVSDRVQYLSHMGYCPQQDAIIDTLNAWDHLYLFARLRGIPSNEVDTVVRKWVTKLNLTACAAHPSGTYSGGNKRRLNIAMALIGNPPLVLMDEPTTGVDPAARRSLWNTLKSCQEAGQSIILTSHSMEECEVLCNRLVIMVRGQIVCVGPSQELKQRFGAGYNIHVKLTPTRGNDDIANIKQRIESSLTCKLVDENTGFLGYHVTDPQVSWTTMYTLMDELNTEFSCIEDFAILSSTLEQLFIQFARGNSSIDDTDNNLVNGAAKRKRRRKATPSSPV